MFKVGDKVRRTEAGLGVEAGDVVTITELSPYCLRFAGQRYPECQYDPQCFEPVIECADVPKTTLPTDSAERKNIPLAEGFLFYFPAAIAEVAKLSKAGNDQHNPGQPMHWARDKSKDHHDCLMRHLLEAGTFDTDGVRHSAKVAWRALAALQVELEAAGAPVARNAK